MRSAGSCPLPSAPGTVNINHHQAPDSGISDRPKVRRPEELKAGREQGCPCSCERSQIKSPADFAEAHFELRHGAEGFLQMKGGRRRSGFLIYCCSADQPSPPPPWLRCHPSTHRDRPAAAGGAAGCGGAVPFPGTFFWVMAIKLQPAMPRELSWGNLTKA